MVRDKQRSEDTRRVKVTRAANAASNATTTEEIEDVFYSNDVVDILCGPSETKIRQLQKQLRDEKLRHNRTQRCV